MAKILAVDLGTTYFKAALFDDGGAIAHLAHEAPPIVYPRRGWWELDAHAFLDIVARLIAALREQNGGSLDDVAAVSFATQANSFLLLDGRDQPLTPIILWPDTRAASQDAFMRKLGAELPLAATTGIPNLTQEFSAAKLRWLRDEQPDAWRSARRLCYLSDYLTLWLTGEHVTEAGMAGLSSMVDIHRLRWWPEAVERIGVPPAWLPRVARAGTDVGPIRAAAMKQTGLPSRCRFVLGCLDQFAGAIGAGNVAPGGFSETTGTVLATVRCADRFNPAPPPGVFQGPGFDEGIYFPMAFGSISANLLEAYRNSLLDKPTFGELDRLAAQVPPGAGGLRVAEKPDPTDASTLFANLTARHTRGEAVRAILEAVAFALDLQVKQLCGQDRPTEIRSVGGAAKSDLWRRIKADVLNLTITATTCPEPTSLGAAMLAARALRPGSRLADLARQWVRTREPDQPDRDRHRQYATLRNR